jgi:NitT/TauT family transport system substrate-binding protein
MKLKRTCTLMLALLTLVMAGCSSNKPSTTETPQTQAAVKTLKTTMAVGGKASIVYLPPVVAEYAGYFKDQHLDIESSDMKSGADAAQALIGGSVDFASMAVDHAIKAKAQGTDLVVLAAYTRYSGVTLVVNSKYKDQVKSIKDLKGMKVGVSGLGSGTHLALSALLVKNGMKPTDVEVIAVGTNTMPAAMENNTVVAAMHVDPFVTQLVTTGKAFILYDLATEKDTLSLYGSEYPFTALVTRQEVIKKNPELVQRMVNATATALKFLAEKDAAAIAKVLPAEYNATGELYLKSLEHSKPALSPTGMLTKEGVQTVLKALTDSGSIKAGVTVDPNSIFDMSFLNKATNK